MKVHDEGNGKICLPMAATAPSEEAQILGIHPSMVSQFPGFTFGGSKFRRLLTNYENGDQYEPEEQRRLHAGSNSLLVR